MDQAGLEFWRWFDSYADPRLGVRSNTFRKMFEHLDKFKSPIIVETGCIGDLAKEGDDLYRAHGCSTILFDKYVSLNGGHFWSVDLDNERVQNAKKMVNGTSKITCSDSVEFLKGFDKSPHLVYLDSWDLDRKVPTESQVHHYNELKAIFPKLTPDTLVAVDDSPVTLDEEESCVVGGKGTLVSRYADELGVPLAFTGYQTGWLGFPGFRNRDITSNYQLLFKARALTEEGKWTEAYPLYKRIFIGVRSSSDDKETKIYGETCAFFARMAANYNRFGTAHDWYRRALIADPSANNYRLEMITRAMKPLGWMTVARVEAIRATEISQNDPIAWNVLGEIESDLKNYSASLAAYSKFVETDNRSTLSLLTKATSLIRNEKYEEAEILCDEVILRNESLGAAFACKADALASQDDHEGAIDLYNKALKHGYSNESMIRYQLSLSLFSLGKQKEGWQNSFRARIDNESWAPLYTSMRRFTKPLKQLFVMQPPPAVVHIHADAGEGDILALMRYLPLLAAKGYTVRYESRKSTIKLVQDSFPDVEVIPLAKNFPGISGLPDFDYHLPIPDLPFIFQTDIDTIPWNGPYIKADPKLVEEYKSHKGKIGLCWSTPGHYKSLSFDLLKPIIDVDPSMFVALQAGSERIKNNRIVDPMPKDERIMTWADTAALVENLDLVITIDTSVAHLAGAMGKPTWLMMHKYLTSWQFMGECQNAFWNTSSPWYPSMCIFRQKSRGDWASVVTNIAAELDHKLGSKHVGA